MSSKPAAAQSKYGQPVARKVLARMTATIMEIMVVKTKLRAEASPGFSKLCLTSRIASTRIQTTMSKRRPTAGNFRTWRRGM